ncbi:MAG: hypothetical protein ACHQ50_14425 [Fimbriimonadales bacterium]
MAPRVFGYRNFSTLSYALMSVPAALFPIGPLVFAFDPKHPAPIEVVVVLLAIGFLGFYFTIKHLLTWSNERILLSDQEIVWYDAFGRVRVRSPMSTIPPGSLTAGTPFRISVGGVRSNQRGWKIETPNGAIKFRSIISDCSELVGELGRRGALGETQVAPESNFHVMCNYHSAPTVVGAMFGLIFCGVAAYFAFMVIDGQVIDSNSGEPASTRMAVFPILGAVAGLALTVYFAMAFVNERIVVAGDQIVWHDKLGRDRIRCASADILPGSFRATQKADKYGNPIDGFWYQVGTRFGVIKFDTTITNAAALADHFQRLAQVRPAVASTDEATPDARGWSADPLKDPDQNNIPIR